VRDPRPLESAYDDWHAQRPIDVTSNTPWHLQLKKWLPSLAGQRVLEIGCGRGGFAAWLAHLPPDRRPSHIVAADFSPVAVQLAAQFGKSTGVAGVEYRVANLMSLEWPDSSFDAVISCETLEHLAEPRRGISEVLRVLRPGGRFYLTCPNYLNLTGLHRLYRAAIGRPYTEEDQPVDHLLLEPRVRAWLRKAGFHVERSLGVGHYVPFAGRPPVRIHLLDVLPIGHWFSLHSVIFARKPG
jgi:ubiquinone/menaquinone biosynthesis C-methylase UbiE